MGAAEQLNYQDQPDDQPKSGLHLVESKEAMDQIRGQVEAVAQDSFRKGYIPKQYLDTYMQMKARQEKGEMTMDQMQGMLEYASNFDRINDEFHGYIEEGIRDGYMSEVDKEYWLENYLDDPDLVGNEATIKRKLLEKVRNRKKNRATFDQLTKHPFVEKGRVDLGFMNKMLTLKSFLEAEVPDRIKFLDALHAEIQKCEEEDEAKEKERKENIKHYTSLLEKEKGKGNIGKKTMDEFLGEFKLIDLADQQKWIKGIKGEMAPRQVLRDQIKRLPQEDQLAFSQMREEMGYHELMQAYIDMKPKLAERYMGKIEKYRKEGLFGDHTVKSFHKWINAKNRSIDDRVYALKNIEPQIDKYRALHVRAKAGLTEEELSDLKAQIADPKSEWGYSEYDQYITDPKFREQHSQSNVIDLNQFRADSSAKKKAMADAIESARNEGQGAISSWKRKITYFLRGKTEKDSQTDHFQEGIAKDRQALMEKQEEQEVQQQAVDSQEVDSNADNLISLQGQLRQQRSQQEVSQPEGNEGDQDASYAQVIDLRSGQEEAEQDSPETSNLSTRDQIKSIERNDSIKVQKEAGFKKITSTQGGEEHTSIQVTFNSVGANQAMKREADQDFEDNDVGFQAWADGKTHNLDDDDMRDMLKVLEDEGRKAA